MDIINLEKQKSKEFAEKSADIYFETLLRMRPPEVGRLHCETPEAQKNWEKWNEYYSFKDDHNELINEAIQGKSAQ